MELKHASFFSGIEGFGFAADAIGWKNVLHCEKELRLLELLKYYYPNAASYDDITKADFTKHRGTIDVLTGGFPCQPYSSAGLQKGTDDERHLWPEMRRGIREIQPTWVVGENVRGIISWNAGLVFEQVQLDLEAEGYEVQTFLLPAAGVNAPHERYRTWFVAYNANAGNETMREPEKCFDRSNNLANSTSERTGKIRNESQKERSQTSNELPRCGSRIFDASNSNSNRNERLASAGNRTNENTPEWANFFEQTIGFGAKRIIADPNGFGLWREVNRAGKPRITKQNGTATNWEDFPTQSPICDGNNGVPTESLRSFILHNSDGVLTEKEIDQILSKTITATKLEIIKAGGNAIVPQVAMQIFKAIDLYTKQYS